MLEKWKQLYQQAASAYAPKLQEMAAFNSLYTGTRSMQKSANSNFVGNGVKKASVVRNITSELIEAQVSSDIPQPKVTAKHKEYAHLATLIEDWLRGELDRLPMEFINDLDERTTPIQGGDFYLIEWDNERHTHLTSGEISIELLHPAQVIPQPGVTNIPDMDYIFVNMAQTKDYIKAKYKVDVSDETESTPSARGFNAAASNDMVTQHIVYFRNQKGGIGRFSWVNDTVIEDMEDYQARRLRYCKKCGQPVVGESCKYCGSKKWEEKPVETEDLFEDITLSDGSSIPSVYMAQEEIQLDEYGNAYGGEEYEAQTKLPYYRPDTYPIIIRRNTSQFGEFLGESDAKKIRDQQESVNKTASKIEEKLMGGGSFVSLPATLKIETTDAEFKIIRLNDPAEKALIDVYTMQPDVSKDQMWYDKSYQTARDLIGITDSFQGRYDPSAQSGRAKEFSAAQAAGRLESKRVMKQAAYAEMFELMFKFFLAYADEPRAVRHQDLNDESYTEFSRYDFLRQDDSGEWYWIADEFLFSVDVAAPLASNREAMWREAKENLQYGAFGDPKDLKSLIRYWAKLSLLHYPGAEETKRQLIEELEKQQMAMQNAPPVDPAQFLAQKGAEQKMEGIVREETPL